MGTSINPTDQVILRFSVSKLLRMFAPIAVLVVISVILFPDQWRNPGVIAYLFLGGIALFFLFSVIVLPTRYYLLLSSDGLTVQYVGSNRHYSWDEMHNFRVVKVVIEPFIPIAEKVAFDLLEDSASRGAVAKVAGKVLGYEVSILVMYGIRAQELVSLLYDWQQRYGAHEV